MSSSLNRRRVLRAACSLASLTVVALAWASVAQASPEAAAGHGAHASGGLGDLNWFELKDDQGRPGMIFVIINFAVLMFILDRLLFRNLRAGHREKRDKIKLDLDRASEAREKAEALISEFEGRLEKIDAEEKRILADAKALAVSEGERIIEEAQAEAEKIKHAAVMSAQREAANSVQRLEAEIIGRAMEQAEAKIRAGFSDTDQRGIVDAYATEVAAANLRGTEGQRAS